MQLNILSVPFTKCQTKAQRWRPTGYGTDLGEIGASLASATDSSVTLHKSLSFSVPLFPTHKMEVIALSSLRGAL